MLVKLSVNTEYNDTEIFDLIHLTRYVLRLPKFLSIQGVQVLMQRLFG